MSRWVLATGLLCLFFIFSLSCHRPMKVVAVDPQFRDRPRLAVLVIFDQLRGDYLERWESLFGEDGFHRLQHDGAWFQNCHYPYAHTVTGCGHASVLTGCSPATHGIVGNEWYDRAAGEVVNCVVSERYQRVPPTPAAAKKTTAKEDSLGEKRTKGHGAPDRLLAPTLGDALKAATGGRSRIVSLSFKDRSAILPAGRQPDACYWSAEGGKFVTSTYYRERLHPWVEKFNAGKPADRWRDMTWDKLRPDLDYERYSGPDDVAGEGKGAMQGRTFPHPMGSLLYYQALYNSPFGNELLLDLVKKAIDAEHLGHGPVPDLLCVSFSCNDPIGHIWGPDSQEVLDVTLRSDLIVKELMAHLDARVGKDRYILALTADHGVCPLPEVSRAKGKDAGRVSPSVLRREAEAFLDETFSKGEKTRWIENSSEPWFYLRRDVLQGRGLKQSDVEEALAGWLKKQPGIQTAYTRTQLLGELPADDALGQSVRLSFHPDRCGDVAIILKPYYLFTSALLATSHSSSHSYDTHVPLLVHGPGVQKGIRKDPVTPQATAAILAQALGIKPPARSEAPVPDGLFNEPAK